MLSELIEEIEERLRLIVREEIRIALLESKEKVRGEDHSVKTEKQKPVAKTNFPTLLTANDVAEILGVKVQRVYELTRARKANGFPVIVLGERQYRYSREDILAWIKRVNQ